MNPPSTQFQYQAVAKFSGYIRYSPEEGEKPGDTIQLLKSTDEFGEEYRIYAKLSLDKFVNAVPTIETLILEKDYPTQQNLEDFWEYAKGKINSSAYRLVAFSGDWSATVDDVFVKDNNGDEYRPPAPPEIRDEISQYLGLKTIDKSKFSSLITTPKSQFLDEYIERYYFIENNLIKNSKIDPVLLLVSLSSLFELIQENERSPLTEDPLLKATRNLVVHGLVKRKNTYTPLQQRLGTTETEFKFSRNNLEYMKLVREANLKLFKIITDYIENTLLR